MSVSTLVRKSVTIIFFVQDCRVKKPLSVTEQLPLQNDSCLQPADVAEQQLSPLLQGINDSCLQPGTLFLISQLLQQGALGYSIPRQQQLSANSLRQLLPKVSPELPQKGISATEAQQQGPVGAGKWWYRTVLRIRILMFFRLQDPDL